MSTYRVSGTQVTGTIVGLERRQRSREGNPRFDVTIRDAAGVEYLTCTAPNAGLAYAIENREFAEVEHLFTIDGRGNISTAERA